MLGTSNKYLARPKIKEVTSNSQDSRESQAENKFGKHAECGWVNKCTPLTLPAKDPDKTTQARRGRDLTQPAAAAFYIALVPFFC